MSNETIKKILEDSYDESKEDSLVSIGKEFYSRKLLSTAILVWGLGLVFLALVAHSAVQFLRSDQTREQIMYATLFICGVNGVGLMKIFAWEMVHRQAIKREIKKLELRVAQLSEAIRAEE